MNEAKLFLESSKQYLQEIYPGYPQRFLVPENKRSWDIPFDYNPPKYTFVRKGKEKLADPIDPNMIPNEIWKQREKYLTQMPDSKDKKIQFDKNGYSLNPIGRTGIEGRGILEKWGPNPCADPIIFRKNDDNLWELLVVVRQDNGKIALPGGKIDIDNKETVVDCAKREALEETGLEFDFSNALPLPYGHINDERETDNSWFVTEGVVVVLHHSENKKYNNPQGASDAKDAKWLTIDENVLNKMHAEHGKLVQYALQKIENKSI